MRAATSSRSSTAPTRPLPVPQRRPLAPIGPATPTTPAPCCGGPRCSDGPCHSPDLAAVAELAEDDVLDHLGPAMGLPGWCVRWARTDSPSPTPSSGTRSPLRPVRRGSRQLHARSAEVLEARPGRESEVAGHWRAAGRAYTARAWRAAAAAGGVARRRHASDAAVELFTAALDTVVFDTDATAQDRYGLLMEDSPRCPAEQRLAQPRRRGGGERRSGWPTRSGSCGCSRRPAAVSPVVRCGSAPPERLSAASS